MNTNIVIAAAIGIAIGGFLAINNARAKEQTREARGWELIEAGALLVDARTASEFAAGHLEGAINIPHDETLARLSEFGGDRQRSIVVYCRSGRRSGIAHDVLMEQGYMNVHNAGGYEPMLTVKP